MDSILFLTGDVCKPVIRHLWQYSCSLTWCSFKSASKDDLIQPVTSLVPQPETRGGNSQSNERPGYILTVVVTPVLRVNIYDFDGA